ncbi:MAG TPA: restriction endonuclease subunit S [Ruminococcus sp.]|nr:restriction endonuclease subunit S [Ruminococcus sp.]
MTPQELKQSILQLAIQGKLTEHLSSDGTAKELIDQTLIDDNVDGQRVKQKIVTDITDDEKTFEIPETWEWVKLGNVCTIARGGSPRPIKDYITTAENGVNWIKIGDTEKNGKYISSTAEKIKPSGVSKSRMVHSGDFLLTNSMSFGRPYILKVDGCIHDGWLVISQPTKIFNRDYLYWLLSSNFAYIQFCGKVSGAVVKNLNSDKVANSVFPLPPLAEQKRIVAKIEELLPYIDRYEKAWSRLEDLNKRFPVDMQKSILQMAIQGKLVEQRPEEGTAEELYQQIQEEKKELIKAGKIKKRKPLPEITEDEIPFDIPESWKWVRFDNLCAVLTCGYASTPTYVSENDGMPFISAKNVKPYRFMPEDHNYISYELYNKLTQNAKPEKGDILLTRVGAGIGEAAIIDTDLDFAIYVSLTLIKLVSNNLLDNQYILYWLNSPIGVSSAKKNIYGKNASQGNLNVKNVRDFLVPLPPLAEQKRIVAKLEEILPLCDKLK